MTDTNFASSSAAASSGSSFSSDSGRPAWEGSCSLSSVHDLPFPAKAAGVAVAFWAFPPLGVASLVWLAMARRRRMRRWAAAQWGDYGAESQAARFSRRCGGSRGWRRGFYASSGNSAFDEAQRAEIERLREEARKLHEEAEAFRDFERREKEKRDREIFDQFAAERNKPKPEAGGKDAPQV